MSKPPPCKPEPDATPTGSAEAGPVMLAQSTFRHSARAVAMAIRKAKATGSLAIVHVVDVNLARYVVGADLAAHKALKQKCEAELLEAHRQRGQEEVAAIAEEATGQGIPLTTHVEVGRFALVCLAVARQIRPSLIITTRSRRPAWVKRFFGSPVDQLIAEAPCPVVET